MTEPLQEEINNISKIIQKRLLLDFIDFSGYSYPNIIFKVGYSRGNTGRIRVNKATGRVFEFHMGAWKPIDLILE